MPLDFAISALVTLLVVVDPVGLAPTFLAVTEGLPDHARKSVALRAALIAGAILIGSVLIGDWLLRALGISLPAFLIAVRRVSHTLIPPTMRTSRARRTPISHTRLAMRNWREAMITNRRS